MSYYLGTLLTTRSQEFQKSTPEDICIRPGYPKYSGHRC